MLLYWFESKAGIDGRPALNPSRLWERLVLQYSYVDGLSQNDVCERTVSAAVKVGYDLTPDIINSWIGGKHRSRLSKKVRDCWDKVFGGESHDGC